MSRVSHIWLIIFILSALNFSISGQNKKETEPVIKSLLIEIELPPGAVKIKEAEIPDEVKTVLAKLISTDDKTSQQTDSKVKFQPDSPEIFIWTENDVSKFNPLMKKFESDLRAAGWKYEILKEKDAGPALFSLIQTKPAPRKLVGFFLQKDKDLFLAVTKIKAEENNAAAAVNVTGKWNMIAEAQGLTVPVTLELKQSGETVSGTFSSHIGGGTIHDIKVTGNKLQAIAKVEVQGRLIDLNLRGEIDGDKMKGTLLSPGLPPINFTAEKAR